MKRRGQRFNAASHLAGAVLSAAGLALLVVLATFSGDALRVVSSAVYGSTLVVLYLISTLHHAAGAREGSLLQRLDHAAIYLLIAGTYTPIALVSLPRGWGWSLFGVEWGLAAAGCVLEFLPWRGRRIVAHPLYVVMGWLAVIALRPLRDALSAEAIAWIFAGGVSYTVGLVVYAWRSIPRHHEIWHLFVLAGSACHFVVVMNYLPGANHL